MATIETRKRGNGTTAYRLKWRYAGKRDGAAQSITYDDQGDAKAMKGAVEALRHLVYADDPRVQTFELVTGQREVTYTGPTFGDAVAAYVSTRTRARVDTKDLYRRTLTCQARGLLSRPVESVTDDDIRRVLAEITDAGKSVRMLYDLLGSVFKYATHKQWITVNPMRDVEAPRKRGRTTNFLDTSDAGILVRECYAMRRVGARLGVLVETLLATGLRISEALGLIVADAHVADPDNAWLDVELQLARYSRPHAIPTRIPLKTRASVRRVVLDRATAVLLTGLIADRPKTAPLFANPTTGRWWSHQQVSKAFARARDHATAAGMVKRPRIHDLRHTHAAWLLTDGVPLLAVSRRLGHESIAITAGIYGHLLPEADDEIRRVVAKRRATLLTAAPGSTRSPANRKAANTAPGTRKAAERTTAAGKPGKASTDAITSSARSKGKGSAPAA